VYELTVVWSLTMQDFDWRWYSAVCSRFAFSIARQECYYWSYFGQSLRMSRWLSDGDKDKSNWLYIEFKSSPVLYTLVYSFTKCLYSIILSDRYYWNNYSTFHVNTLHISFEKNKLTACLIANGHAIESSHQIAKVHTNVISAPEIFVTSNAASRR
jgi:hypothetical protein